MTALLEIYDTSLTTAKADQVDIGDIEENEINQIYECKIQNDGDSTATNVRLFCRCLNGLYSGQNDDIGNEIVVSQYVEVDVAGGGYNAIGGDFAGGSSPSPAGNYVSLSDIAAGANSGTVTFRLNLPSGISTAGDVFFQIGVSYKE